MGPLAAAFSGLVLLAAPAAPDEWDEVLWPLESVELSQDPGVFALFAALNACGLDDGEVVRTEPSPRVAYRPLRQAVRDRVRARPDALATRLEAFLDAHQLPAERYLAALHEFPPAEGLRGLRPLLGEAWPAWQLEVLAAQGRAEARQALRGWVPVVQGPLRRTLALLKAPGRQVRLVSNLLDAPGTIRTAPVPGDRLVLVLGPAGDDAGLAVAQAVAREALAPLVARHIGGWTRGPLVVREARMDGAKERTPAELATSLLSQVVASHASGRTEAGPLVVTLEQSRTLEGWVRAALPRLAWSNL
jgi:hypothetical protein